MLLDPYPPICLMTKLAPQMALSPLPQRSLGNNTKKAVQLMSFTTTNSGGAFLGIGGTALIVISRPSLHRVTFLTEASASASLLRTDILNGLGFTSPLFLNCQKLTRFVFTHCCFAPYIILCAANGSASLDVGGRALALGSSAKHSSPKKNLISFVPPFLVLNESKSSLVYHPPLSVSCQDQYCFKQAPFDDVYELLPFPQNQQQRPSMY